MKLSEGKDILNKMEELRKEESDEKRETRTISVSGLPEGSTENSVYIHFQKKKNGGGEIEKVELQEQGKAIVVFEDPQGRLKTLLKMFQRYGGYSFFHFASIYRHPSTHANDLFFLRSG